MAVTKITLNVENITTLKSMYKKGLIIGAVLSLVIAIFDSGSFISVFLFGLFIIIPLIFAGISAYNLFCIRFGFGFIKKNQQKTEQALKDQGFQVSFSANGLIIDDNQKKFAFLSSTGPETVICDYSDIRSWRKESLTETTQHRNHENAYAGSTTKTHVIHIVVSLSSPEYPEARFLVSSDREASIWLARLNALVNG